MKKFFGKPCNLLFTASAVILVQLLSSAVCFFMQAVVLSEFDYLSDYIYMAYCLLVCVVIAVFIAKNKADKKNKNMMYAKFWLVGFFLYAFTEIFVFIKIYLQYDDSTGYSDFAYSLWDNQYIYRLYLYIAVIFMIYFLLYILEKKSSYIVFAAVNLLLFALVMIFLPDAEFLLLTGSESALEVITVSLVREAGSFIFMTNMFIFSIRELY